MTIKWCSIDSEGILIHTLILHVLIDTLLNSKLAYKSAN